MPTINIMPDELQTQIGKLNSLYDTCQSHKPDDIKKSGEGDSINAIGLIVGEYKGLQTSLATLIQNAANYFQKTLDTMSKTDRDAAELFEGCKVPPQKPTSPIPKEAPKIPATGNQKIPAETPTLPQTD